MDRNKPALSGDLYTEHTEFTLEEVCRCCTVADDHLVEMVHEGVVEVSGGSPERWRFRLSSVKRIRTAVRLQRDLGVNLAGAALALDLLERISELESRLGKPSGQ